MATYSNSNRNSSIYKYYTYSNRISIYFKKYGKAFNYKYSTDDNSSHVISNMKFYAKRGYGLNSYINRVQPAYYRKRQI
jgi:hypothetical protein